MKVFWAIVDHRHGRELFLATTKQNLNEALHLYVGEWWDDSGLSGKVPKNPRRAIKRYFDFHSNNGTESLEEGVQKIDEKHSGVC